MSYCFKNNSREILNMVLIDMLKSRWLTLEGFCTEVEIMEKDKYKNSSHCWGIKSLLQPHLCELLAEAVNSAVNKALRGQQFNKLTLRRLELFCYFIKLIAYELLVTSWTIATVSSVVSPMAMGNLQWSSLWFILQSNCFSPHFILVPQIGSSWIQFLYSFPVIRAERLQQQFHVQSCPVTVCLEPTETLRVWFSLMSLRVDPQLPYRTLKCVQQHAPLILLSSNWPWNFTYIWGEEKKERTFSNN